MAQLTDAQQAVLLRIQELTAELPGMPEFYKTCVRLMSVHARKNADYTGTSGNPLFNFLWTAGFNHGSLKEAFRHHEGNKIARLLSLDSADEDAHNESVEDTLDDLAIYVILERAARDKCGAAFFEPVEPPSPLMPTGGFFTVELKRKE